MPLHFASTTNLGNEDWNELFCDPKRMSESILMEDGLVVNSLAIRMNSEPWGVSIIFHQWGNPNSWMVYIEKTPIYK